MRITFLDAFTLNPGDLSWTDFEQLGELEVYERTSPDKVLERAFNQQVLITNKVTFSASILQQLPQLRLLLVSATGYNIIDTEAATRKGIVVCNVPGYGTSSVAQHTFALLLELTNQVGIHHQSVQQGEWSRAKDWCYALSPLTELAGLTLGIVGMGNIGQKVAQIGAAFGMDILYYTSSPHAQLPGKPVDLYTLLEESDVVSLHCPLNERTKGMINRNTLSLMKPSALLLNTSRGGLIAEQDLAEALHKKQLGGAALDVLSSEPPPPDHPLLHAPRCLITPHNAWLSRNARQRIMDILAENLRAYLKGTPQHRVN
jgi:glycerate dehydrogenase